MSNRKSSYRAISVFVIIIAVTAIGFAANWTSGFNPLSFLAPASAAPAAEPAKTSEAAPAQPLSPLAVCTLGNAGLPIEVFSTGGTPDAAYATLGAAFTAINAGTHTGTLTISVCGNSTEAASAVLNASGSGSASYASIGMNPVGAWTISGAITGHLIDLNGADNVTIDGLNTGGNSLAISNTATGASSTIRFIADATNNTVQNATITGSTTSFGVVYFSTGITTGNDGNNINNCNITAAGANNPLNGVYSFGTSSTIDNSGITLNANNISDYFSAGSATSGINANTGSSSWTITNNKLFQSATRVYTSASTHNGINITAGVGYTITGNTIGYANSSGTGTTNIVGNTVSLTGTFPSAYTTTGTSNATRYIAINAAFTAGGAVSSIQNNTIAGFALYTSSGAATTNGIFCGIAVTSGNVNIGTTTGNTIGTATSSIYTASTTSGALVAGIYVTSSNTVNIQGNTVQNIDSMGTTSSLSGSINGINAAGSGGTFVITGNTIGNSTNPNLRMGNLTTGASLSNTGTTFGSASGTGVFNGILNAQSGTVTIGTAASPNMITNASVNSTGSSSTFRGISTSAGTVSIVGNSISNITSALTNVATTSGALAGLGIYFSGGTAPVISQNTISGLSLTNTGTGGYNLAGISYTVPTTSITITRNKISGLSNASTSTTATTPGTAAGIFFRDGNGAATTVANNMISLGNAQTANTTFIGLWLQYGSSTATTAKLYHNSVNIEGTATSGAQASFAFLRGDLSATANTVWTIDAKNNIFTNTRSGGTGKHYVIANSFGATASSTGWGTNASNYNVLNGNAANIGYWTADKTFATWKTASASDANSYSGIGVSFVNTATGDLHLNSGVTPTYLESHGVSGLGITNDFDNDTRPGPAGSINGGAFAPDLGADEFDGVPIDDIPPAISYTALGNISTTGNRSLAVTITDAGGVASGGNSPRIYFKKTTDAAYFSTQCTGSYSCLIDYSLVGGGSVASGDTIQYFVVAQDVSGNLASNPSAGFIGTNVNTVTTPPTTPSSYRIATPLSGSKTVCSSGCDYASLTNVGGVFDTINQNVLTGNLSVGITGDLTSETGAIALNQLGEDGVGGYTTTISPSGATRAITGSATQALIRLNGASRVTIDGSTSGGTDRSLTITNSSATTPSVVLFGSVGTTPIVNDTLKNCIVINGANTSSAVLVEDAGAATAGYFNNITLQNNTVQKAYRGILMIAVASGTNGSGTLITQNDLNTAGANSIRLNPIGVQGANGVTISNNNVGNISDSNAEVPVGIALFSGTDNASVTGNTISGITTTNTGSSASVQGILVSAGASTTSINVSNNTISTMASSGTLLSYEGIGTFSPNTTISNNTISGLTNSGAASFWGIVLVGASNSTVSGNSVSGMSGTVSSATPIAINPQGAITNCKVTGNTVSNITTSAAGSSTSPVGILLSGTLDGNTVQKNKVTGVINGSTSTYGAWGIRVNGGNSHTVSNNFVSNVNHDMTGGGAFSTSFGVFGISIDSGIGHKIYNNSVNLSGATAGTATSSLLSAAFSIVNTTSTGMDVRNNIFANTVTGGTTSIAHVSTYLPTSGTSAMNLTWNNNALYTGATVGVHGVAHVGTTYATPPSGATTYAGLYPAGSFVPSSTAGVSNLRSYTSTLSAAGTNDNASFAATTAAPFTSSTDLHINAGLIPTPLESGGASIAVTTDIDGDARPGPAGSVNGGASALDIGADEFDGVPLYANDMSATAFIDPTNGGGKVAGANFSPQASFTNSGTASQTSVTVRYRICTDGSCSTTLYNNTQTIASIGSGVTSTVTFATTSLSAGTYTIKAKAELAGDQVPANDEITGTITVEAPLSGPYTVGAAGTYSSLTQAINKLNSIGVSGPVTFTLLDATYTTPNETFPLTINSVPGASATNTITIKPNTGATPTISGAVASGCLIKFNSASYVTFDGSNTIGGTTRDLTITNTSPTSPATVCMISGGLGLGSTNDTVKNTNISTGSNAATSYGISIGGSTPGADNDNITIQNNAITAAYVGILASGTTAISAGGDDNLNISNNIIGPATSGSGNIGFAGIWLQNALTATISGNTVQNLVTSASSAGGIYLNGSVNGATVSQNTIKNISSSASSSGTASITALYLGTSVTNATVSQNLIQSISSTTTSGYGVRAIILNTGSNTSAITLSNNMISDVFNYQDASLIYATVGIDIDGSTGGVNIYNNSVNLFGSHTGYASNTTGGVATALFVNTTGTGLDVRDNVLSNSYDNSTSTGDKSYAIYSVPANTAYSSIDVNDYYVSGTGSPVLGFLTTDQTTLALWKTASGQDVNSLAVNPVFVSSTDLHLQATSSMLSVGTSIGAVTNDIDNDPRPASNPDIGADEIVQSVGGVFPTGTFYNALMGTGDSLGGSVDITNTLTLTGPVTGAANVLGIGCGAAVVGGGPGVFVNGLVRKDFCAPGAFSFPVGTNDYTPVNANVTAVTNPSSLTVQSFGQVLSPFSPSTALARNWDITKVGTLTADLSFTFLLGDNPNNLTDLRVWRRESNGTITNMCPGGPCVTGQVLGPVVGVTTFSRWTGAGPLAPSAASASLGGRVTTADGRGIRNVTVVLTSNSMQQPMYALTGPFGYYQFDNLEVGETYVTTVTSKRFSFFNPSRIVSLTDNILNVDYLADPQP